MAMPASFRRCRRLLRTAWSLQRFVWTRAAQQGSALLLALLAVMLLSALGLALVLTTSTETMIANSFSLQFEGLYGAEAGIERALADLQGIADWTAVLAGSRNAAFFDGPSSDKTIPSGATISLARLLAMANCGQVSACTPADMDAVTADRPWGANNPRWRVFGSGPFEAMTPNASLNSPFYIVMLAADDPAETDGDPARDSNGILLLRAEAFGPGESHRVVEVVVARADASGSEHGYLGQQGADTPGSNRSAVQPVGKALGSSGFSIEPGR